MSTAEFLLEPPALQNTRGPSTAPLIRMTFSLGFFPANRFPPDKHLFCMIRKLQSGLYRLYSRKKDAKTKKRKNLGTFATRAAAEKHERAVQYFKRA
jgi:hypothetical protein